jgi:hypothetical protein
MSRAIFLETVERGSGLQGKNGLRPERAAGKQGLVSRTLAMAHADEVHSQRAKLFRRTGLRHRDVRD